MALNLRLTDEDDRALRALAEAQGISKHEATLRAIRAEAERHGHGARVAESADRMLDRWGDVLDRLGEA